MKNKIGKIIIVAVISICTIIFAYIIVTPHKLSAKERLEDFEYLCNIVESVRVQLDDYEDLYNIDFDELKAEYREDIKNCESDAEFYYLINSYLNTVPSIHTNLISPDENLYSKIKSLNSSKKIKRIGVAKQAKYFDNMINKNAYKYTDAKIYLVNYIDGNYYFLSDEADKIISIDSINGNDPDTFITDIQSFSKIHYDHINSTPFYPMVIFNDKYGEKADIKGHYTDGTEIELPLYYSVYTSDVFILPEKDFEFKKMKEAPKSTSKPCQLHIDNENDISYILIDSFDSEEVNEIKEKTINAAQCKNIIIDLRGNDGGYPRTVINGLFVNLFTDTKVFENTFRFKVNDATEYIKPERFSSDSIIKRTVEINETDGIFTEEYIICGEAEKTHNLYFLIDNNTVSAGDEVVSLIKQYKLGTLIGNNTAGEGRTGSYLTDILPNSKLVFNYSFGYNYIEENKENSVYGTAPDIYSQNGIDEYIKKLSTKDSMSYEGRLKWDNVLIETIDIIKEKENQK